jgi:phosphatidylglycerol:prolipoprotein diacylglycerol transferase
MRPTLFYIWSVPVRSFGVMVLIGFLLALWYAMSMARKKMAGRKAGEPGVITPDHMFDFSLMALFVSIIGARILYIVLDWSEFSNNPTDVLKIWTGGISIHGAIISSTLFLWWYCRRHKLSFLRFADLCAPAFTIGYAVGRLGCFLNGCCYGSECNLPWAVRFIKDGREGFYTPPSHPTQIYASLMSLIMLVILHMWSRRPHRDGEIILGFFGLYCIYRFIDEQFRKGATADIFVAGLTHAQVFSLVVLPFVAYFLMRVRRGPAPVVSKEAPVPAP